MNQDTSISTFVRLGILLDLLGRKKDWPGYASGVTADEYEQLNVLIASQKAHNPWFTEDSVRQTLTAWSTLLQAENLSRWLSSYTFTSSPKNVGLIMAGNIPLVGFHDFLSVLLSGHRAVIKLSSDDKILLPALISVLVNWHEELRERIEICPYKLGDIDAIIATGSNNSLHYFEQYFGQHPHIFRKNRTSVAVLTGRESEQELANLGSDIFSYFGLGCRNVSQLFIPNDFDLDRIFGAILPYQDIVNHNKYANNYDYNRTIFLMNQVFILENGFVLFQENDSLFSPLAVIYYKRYSDHVEIDHFLEARKDDIQAVVGHDYIPFGQAQCPALNDYADGVDTMKWLEKL